jgi:enamine deaminase RidA (YjgF/YER057c/UK114 family)
MSAKPQVTCDSLDTASPEARDLLSPPQWALDMVSGAHPLPRQAVNGTPAVDLLDAGDFALASSRIVGAASIPADLLQRRVTETYGAIAAKLDKLAARHPVRLWNHIPSIHERMDADRDRYMVFNAGRYEAFTQWYGGADGFDREVATASGVGHSGADLVVHCLAAVAPGVAIDNPRQIAPHRYSARYGPLPPCFARATLLKSPGLILVGGTASIKGEDSLHRADLRQQLDETLTNLASVVETAHRKFGRAAHHPREHWLDRYREVRVYYPKPADAAELESAVRDAFAPACRIEMRRADLCRCELLVEIEGIAELGA